MTYSEHFKHDLALATKRARHQLDVKPGRPLRLNCVGRQVRVRGSDALTTVFDVFEIDNTRSSRDPQTGRPIPLNDVPIPFLGEAHEYALAKALGRQHFTWRGARAHAIDPGPALPPLRATVTDLVPPNIRGA